MIKIIEKALEQVADDQVNLGSKAAREMIARKIEIALLAEIKKRANSNVSTS